jgi:hypothetical protein
MVQYEDVVNNGKMKRESVKTPIFIVCKCLR